MAARLQRERRKGHPKGYGFRTRAEGRRLRCIKGARHAHDTIRASGRVPGQEARQQVLRNREMRNCQTDAAEEHTRHTPCQTLAMRFLASICVAVCVASCSLAQNAPPPWPNIPLGSCPVVAHTSDPNERAWKYGQPERSSFARVSQLVQAKDYTSAADEAAKFVQQYPDSEYKAQILVLQITAYTYLKNQSRVVEVAEQMVRLPSAEPGIREGAFVELTGSLSPYVRPDDPDKEHKLRDLDMWAKCGEEALAARLSIADVPKEASESTRKIAENVLNRTEGFVAYMRKNNVLADTKLEAAAKVNSEDALTYLLLGTNKFFLPVPDPNSGIFYLARYANLVPQSYWAKPEAREASAAYLKQMYVIIHGSDKGLADVMKLAGSNTDPPAGFNVLPPPKVKHHYGSVIAATAIAGLLAYGFAAHPELMGEVGQTVAGSLVQSQPAKLMLFGGPGHKVYLGCLSCSEVATDSVFNSVGPHGSNVSSESIWNTVSEYGSSVSSFSACNRAATDPPVIVDQDGQAYGRLTVNRYLPQIGAGARFYDWLVSAVCQR